ncbi:hypothetical protein BC826DRAFT_726348 [Russula brevipes]|nr:hypothetical protein BC826DRAFT_726348 [Russula brevipes]
MAVYVLLFLSLAHCRRPARAPAQSVPCGLCCLAGAATFLWALIPFPPGPSASLRLLLGGKSAPTDPAIVGICCGRRPPRPHDVFWLSHFGPRYSQIRPRSSEPADTTTATTITVAFLLVSAPNPEQRREGCRIKPGI